MRLLRTRSDESHPNSLRPRVSLGFFNRSGTSRYKKVLKANVRRRILAWSDRGFHALSLLRFDTQTMFAPKATSYGERAKPSVSCGPAALCVQRIGRTTEAISMRKSWKPSECDQTSSLHRLVGDFDFEDHLFIDLMINHRVRSLDPRSLLAVAVAHDEARVLFLD